MENLLGYIDLVEDRHVIGVSVRIIIPGGAKELE